MYWPSVFQTAALLASTGLSLWGAGVARSRRTVPGGTAFTWLMAAVALWSLTSALGIVVAERDARILISKVQYLGIAPIGVLWLHFTGAYSRVGWLDNRPLRLALWIVPVATVAVAATNEAHLWLWSSIVEVSTPGGVRLVYNGGPWYWLNVAYTYGLLAVGTFTLARGVRQYPPPYRRQTLVIIVGVLVPWAGNVLYLARVLPAGLDLTPIAFSVSGMSVAWGLFRYQLFGVVPIARKMVVDSMSDGVLVLDEQRRIVDLNAAAERYTGCTPASLGRPVDTIVPWWTAATADEPANGLPTVIKTEPGPRYFEVQVSPVRDQKGRFVGWLVTIHDVTNRRRGEAERYALERRMQEQQKAESLTVLAGGMAHDFNNLLTGILGNAELLAMQAPLDSPPRRAAEAIVIGAQRAADLVSKMLAYSGGGRVVAEPVDLDALVREMVELLDASVARHCTLTYKSPGPLPLVETDPTQIRQVVLNLIINATEAVDEHGLVTVETGRELLDREALRHMRFGSDVPAGPYVFIDVVDNGHGMNDETLARIFDPFFSTKETGRGLGMAAVRGIVRSHNAALRVTTAPGQGTRFRVWFPLVQTARLKNERIESATKDTKHTKAFDQNAS